MNGTRILQVAATREGIRYALPPNGTTTLDCSLFVLKTFEDAGYPFPPDVRTAEQIRQACIPVSFEIVQPGDLLFFEHTYNAPGPAGSDGRIASHIGISFGTGSGKMWDAHDIDDSGLPGVGITNIRSAYWQSKIFQAGRPKEQVIPVQPATEISMRVSNTNGLGVRVRQEPNTTATVLGKIEEGTTVSAAEYDWRFVKTGVLSGWVADDYLTLSSARATGSFSVAQVAHALNAPEENVERNLPLIYFALERAGIADRATTIAALATIAVETGNFAPIEEIANGEDYEGNSDLGNTEPGDGRRYKGRGFVQITGRYNYRHYGQEAGVDLESNPELALEPDTAAHVLAAFFKDHDIPRLANNGDWSGVRRAVNGGLTGLAVLTRAVAALQRLEI